MLILFEKLKSIYFKHISMKANNRQILTIIKDPRGKNKSNERSQTIICCLFQNMYTAFFFLFQYSVYIMEQYKNETWEKTILTWAPASFKALTIAVSIYRQTTSGACTVSRHWHVTISKDISLTFTNRKPFGPLSNDCKGNK